MPRASKHPGSCPERKGDFLRRLAPRLQILAETMQQLGTAMDYYGGCGEIGAHGRELVGAARLARGWAAAIEAAPQTGAAPASVPVPARSAIKLRHLCATCARWEVNCPLEPVYAVTACVEYVRRKP